MTRRLRVRQAAQQGETSGGLVAGLATGYRRARPGKKGVCASPQGSAHTMARTVVDLLRCCHALGPSGKRRHSSGKRGCVCGVFRDGGEGGLDVSKPAFKLLKINSLETQVRWWAARCATAGLRRLWAGRCGSG